MEDDRREEPQTETAHTQPEPPSYSEERREEFNERSEERSEYSESGAPASYSGEGSDSYDAPPREDAEASGPGNDSGADQSQGGPSGPPPQERGGGGRGRRGRRLSSRDRRGSGRGRRGGRDRERAPFSSSHQGGGFQHGHSGGGSRDSGVESHRGESPNRSQGGSGSALQDVRAEVERVREVLEGVLRDLEDVADQLTKAEHEKDLAEAEIEQLRDSLRRLHR